MFDTAYFTVFSGYGLSTGITLVFIGLYYSGYGKTFMNKVTYYNVETGINVLGFILNHFCHFFLGYFIGINFDLFRENLSYLDYINVITFYLLSYLTRFLSIICFGPLIKGLANYDLSLKKVILLTLSNFKIDMSLLIALFAFT